MKILSKAQLLTKANKKIQMKTVDEAVGKWQRQQESYMSGAKRGENELTLP
jgi:hypothetical protein